MELAEGQTEENMQEWFDQLGIYFSSLPTQQYPHLVRMAPFMVQGGGDQRLEFALDIMINGLARQREGPHRRPRQRCLARRTPPSQGLYT